MSYSLDGYVDVPTRIRLFLKQYPEGSLQMESPQFVDIEGKHWVIGRAFAYRNPSDERPGIGTAWEPVPGTTPFTRGSEIQNLETSAWGRAIAALGIGVEASVASMNEIQLAKDRQSKIEVTSEPTAEDDPFYTQPAKTEGYSTGKTSKGSNVYKASPAQINAIGIILEKRGIKEQVDKLAAVNEYLTSHMSEPITKIVDLRKHDASQLIDYLKDST